MDDCPEGNLFLSVTAAASQPSPSPPNGKPKLCPQCGYASSSQARFCGGCGRKFVPPTATAVPTEPHWGPLRIHLFGRLLAPETASLFLLLSLLATAVFALGLWRLGSNWLSDYRARQAAAQAQTSPAPPPTLAPKRKPHRSKRLATATETNSIPSSEPLAAPAVAAPTITSFHLSKDSIVAGQSAELIWSIDSPSKVAIQPEVGALTGTSGQVTVSPSSTTTYKLRVRNDAGSVESEATLAVLPAPAPTIVSFTANPPTVARGQTIHIAWQVTGNAKNISVDPWFSHLNPEGSLQLEANATTTFTLRAEGPGGTATASTIVEVSAPTAPPVATPPAVPPASTPLPISLKADPDTINQGDSTVLSWQTPPDAKVSLQPGGIFGSRQVPSSIRVKPQTTTTYTLQVDSAAGHNTQSTTVVVKPRAGAATGQIVWIGQVHGAQLVAINRNHANIGSVTGSLPGLPCTVQPENARQVFISSPPASQNNYDRMLIQVTGNGQVRAVLTWTLQ